MPDMPDWVQVWAWLRFGRTPQVMTPLPQQEPHPEAMTMGDFDKYHSEWVNAGRPSISPRQLVAVMAGGAADDEELPF